jgi:hypothetical protein
VDVGVWRLRDWHKPARHELVTVGPESSARLEPTEIQALHLSEAA